jgi:hypothetical protein
LYNKHYWENMPKKFFSPKPSGGLIKEIEREFKKGWVRATLSDKLKFKKFKCKRFPKIDCSKSGSDESDCSDDEGSQCSDDKGSQCSDDEGSQCSESESDCSESESDCSESESDCSDDEKSDCSDDEGSQCSDDEKSDCSDDEKSDCSESESDKSDCSDEECHKPVCPPRHQNYGVSIGSGGKIVGPKIVLGPAGTALGTPFRKGKLDRRFLSKAAARTPQAPQVSKIQPSGPVPTGLPPKVNIVTKIPARMRRRNID